MRIGKFSNANRPKSCEANRWGKLCVSWVNYHPKNAKMLVGGNLTDDIYIYMSKFGMGYWDNWKKTDLYSFDCCYFFVDGFMLMTCFPGCARRWYIHQTATNPVERSNSWSDIHWCVKNKRKNRTHLKQRSKKPYEISLCWLIDKDPYNGLECLESPYIHI